MRRASEGCRQAAGASGGGSGKCSCNVPSGDRSLAPAHRQVQVAAQVELKVCGRPCARGGLAQRVCWAQRHADRAGRRRRCRWSEGGDTGVWRGGREMLCCRRRRRQSGGSGVNESWLLGPLRANSACFYTPRPTYRPAARTHTEPAVDCAPSPSSQKEGSLPSPLPLRPSAAMAPSPKPRGGSAGARCGRGPGGRGAPGRRRS